MFYKDIAMKINDLISKTLVSLLLWFITPITEAGMPLWTFEPITSTSARVPSNGTVAIQYQVINQSHKPHTLVMQPIQSITQVTTGNGVCGSVFTLQTKGSSCILSLLVNGSQLKRRISDGPIVCEQGSGTFCYRPSQVLDIRPAPPVTDATITVTGSPLTLTTNGGTGTLTVNNTSLEVIATNISSNFTGTALDGNVTETANTCAMVAPNSSCTLTYTSGNTAVPQTNFSIQGTNTNRVTAAIEINPVPPSLSSIAPPSGPTSGGTAVTLTGINLSGTVAVLFDGVVAANMNVVNATTITAVTPAHTAGAVNVIAFTPPADFAILNNGYTYLAPAVGQLTGGGVIACLGGAMQNLIVSSADNSTGIQWGQSGTTGAQDNANGVLNTATIISVLGANGGAPYGAQLCDGYEIDSQGNSPCLAGNACYADWFLPAINQLNCLYTNRASIPGFTTGDYLSSTEDSTNPVNAALMISVGSGSQFGGDKIAPAKVRCVRSFVP